MADIAAQSLSEEHKAKLHEVADLMLQIYETLAEMCYVQRAGIIRGPHKITSDMEQQYKDLELDPAIIYLYSILPYIDTTAANADEFFQRSHFFNHMNSRDVEQGRDPWYKDPRRNNPNVGFDDEDGLYMWPWYTPLSHIWERSAVMIYDAREHRIWIAGYDDSLDPFFRKGWYGELEEPEKSDWGGTGDESDWSEEGGDEDEDAASAGSSEFWDDEDEDDLGDELNGLSLDDAPEVDFDEGFDIVEDVPWGDQVQALNIKNDNSLELIQSRDAADVLRDVNRWYRELKELPGNPDGSLHAHGDTKRLLYKKNGWPESFNPDTFMVDFIRTTAAERVAGNDSDRDPAKIVMKCEKRVEYGHRFRPKFTKAVDEAQSADEEWIARYKLFQYDLSTEQHAWDLKEAQEELAREDPKAQQSNEELAPLREYEQLREDVAARRERAQFWVRTLGSADESEENKRHWQIKNGHLGWLLPFYEQALVQARADAQRISPTKFAQPGLASRIESERASLTSSLEELQRMKEFLSGIPDHAAKAREEVAENVRRCEESIESKRAQIAEHEESLKNDEYKD
ncbi:hypothetical protein PRZ48_000282 [Zasmidium cellare]|uniref:Uncharacterized protein n=1 Tax=Zasmidium cellare TaxID=395010 RepID=A0ABR0EZR6_ZASCE|nr:hypothetical protein PRZ48_000282 [Zasmidium cellare]